MNDCYVILLPGSPGNTTDKHLVVHTGEYVDVTRHGKEAYDFVSEHDDYVSAEIERDRLNEEPSPCTPPSTPEPRTEIAVKPAWKSPMKASAPGK
jgi:hypothetical protein